MTRRGVVPGLLLLCGCWAPIEATEDGLRRVVREPSDAGRSGPGVDAGAVDGGAVDGGTLPRVAVIAPVGGPLPEACGALRERLEARLPPDGACGSGCLFTVQEDGGALVFRAGLGGERLWLPIEGGLGPENVVFVSQRDGQRWLVGKPLRGERVVRLQALPDGAIEVEGHWSRGVFHYVVTEGRAGGGATRRSTLWAWSPATPVAALVAALPGPVRAGFGLTADAYVLALDDGLYEVRRDGVQGRAARRVEVTGTSALVVSDTGAFAYGTREGEVVAGEWGAQVTAAVVARGLRASALGLLGLEQLAVFDPERGVFLVDRQRGTLELLYAQGFDVEGNRAVQDMLVAPFSQQVWVKEKCQTDPVTPTYGTVRLDLPLRVGDATVVPGRASWVTGSPEWPWRAPALDGERWQSPAVGREGLTGPFLVHVMRP